MQATTIQTITTRDELLAFFAERDETMWGEIYVRWSHGPERDAAGGWISHNYATDEDEEGLCVGIIMDFVDPFVEITRWQGEVYGETCWLLTGIECGECSDGEPLLRAIEPLAIIDRTALA